MSLARATEIERTTETRASDEQELAARPHLIDAHTFLVYEKQIRNLQLQEARLTRRREKETAELRVLQQDRKQKQENLETSHGFEFSTAAIDAPIKNIPALQIAGDLCYPPRREPATASAS